MDVRLDTGSTTRRPTGAQMPTPALPNWLAGGIAGFIATLPMTLFMLATQPFLPRGQHYDLPPEIIIKELTQRLHVRYRMNKSQILAATLVSHFGYGASMGVLYSLLKPRRPATAPIQGSLFGVLIWVASYLGLLPLVGMSESGHREPKHRNYMMIGAHIIWGATLGLTTSLLHRRRSDISR